MSATTIEIPAVHVGAVRESLVGRRAALGSAEAVRAQAAEIDELLGQLDSEAPAGGSRRLSGSRRALWNAVYDALCAAAEDLADECNDYWRGGVEAAVARGRIAAVALRLDLLEELGPPPAP